MEIVVRTVIIFFFVLFLTRAMGKKELSELTAFELILLVTMGDLVQQGVTQEDQSLTGAILAVGTLGLLIVLLSYLSYKWRPIRRVIRGTAVVVVREGRPDRRCDEARALDHRRRDRERSRTGHRRPGKSEARSPRARRQSLLHPARRRGA